MIKGIKYRRLRRFWETGNSSGLPSQHVEKIQLLLATLDTAISIDRMNIPSGNLHKLTGDLKDYWSLSISRNWRIIFTVGGDGHIYDIDLVDYH